MNIYGIVIDKMKYLVPNNFTIGQFVYVIRKRLTMLPEEAIFCVIKMKDCSVIPRHSDYISKYNENDYVIIYFRKEDTFG
mgnify:CR=1 FL=1